MNRRLFYGLVLIVGILGFIFHPFFEVKHVQISGTHFVSEATVKQMAESIKCKIILSRFFSRQFVEGVMTHCPAIESLELSIDWPSTIWMKIHEKKPWVSFLGQEKTLLVASDGTILNQYHQQDFLPGDMSFIIVRGVSNTHFQGSKIPDDLLLDITLLLHNIQGVFPGEFLQVERTAFGEYMMYKDDRLPIKIGVLDFLELKLSNLREILTHFHDRLDGIEYIDLRIEDRIILKFKGKTV